MVLAAKQSKISQLSNLELKWEIRTSERGCEGREVNILFFLCGEHVLHGSANWISLFCLQVSVVNQLDMQVIVSNVPPTLVEQNKEQLIG